MEKSKFVELLSIPDLVIESLDGRKTIAEAGDIFKSYLDSDFKNWGLDNFSEKTEEAPVQVYEMVQNASFSQMFKSLSNNLDDLRLTQHQIINFCEKYPNNFRQDGYGDFFLFKENDEYFVAFVCVDSGGLIVLVNRFEDGCVWSAGDRLRVVVPQLNLES